MKKLFLNLLWLSWLPFMAARAEFTLELSRNTISADETVDLILKSEDLSSAGIPSISLQDGLRIIGTSRQETVINFQRESSVRYTIKPDQEGTYQIGPFNLKGANKGGILPALTLTVTPAKVIQSTENLFVTLESGSEDLLVQESVELTLTLYSRVNVGDINLQDFETDGFEISKWQQVRGSPVQVGQRMYNTHRFVAQLTPTREGKLKLDPSFRVEVSDRDEPFGMMFGPRSVRVVRLKLKQPLVLYVSNPPEEGRPGNFAGHLGNFRLDARISPKEVKVGDPITRRVELSGTGSLQQALPPGLEESDDFKVYRPKLVTEDLERSGLSGRKIIEQVLIPKHSGVQEVPALSFSYYDTGSRSYKTLQAGPFPLQVLDTGDESVRSFSSIAGETSNQEPEVLGDDLVYLKTRPGKIQKLTSLQPGWNYVGLSGLPFAVWAFMGLLLQHREKAGRDVEGRQRMEAPRRLRKQLQKLEQADAELYPAIWSILSAYLSGRLNLPPGELNPQDTLSRLRDHLSGEMLRSLEEWMRACDRARFAAGPDPRSNSAETKSSFRSFMLNLDRELGK
ncbi:MAG: BatD family protein [Kiritimatiellia bacterium]